MTPSLWSTAVAPLNCHSATDEPCRQVCRGYMVSARLSCMYAWPTVAISSASLEEAVLPMFSICQGAVLLFSTIFHFWTPPPQGDRSRVHGVGACCVGPYSSDHNDFSCKALSHEGNAITGAKPRSAGPMMGKRQRVQTPLALACHIRPQNNGAGDRYRESIYDFSDMLHAVV